MKIGILTFHNANNYGAVLQAYGLQQILLSMGHQVKIVDYRNPLIEKRMNYFSLKYNTMMMVLKRFIISYKTLSKRSRLFREFRNNHLIISRRTLPESLKYSDYDLFVIGSDQVWNPMLTNGVDPVYWANCSGRIPTISYAASSNDPFDFSIEVEGIIGKYIANFLALGVREERLHDFFLKKYGVNSTVVLDPTLLAGHSYFERIECERVVIEPYVLVYCVETQSPLLKDVAYKIAKDKGLKIVVIGSNTRDWDGAYMILPTVPQFLSLIKHADCVVSLSFHGTAFSIIYNKELYSVKGGNMNRVESLLIPLGLQDRIITEVVEVQYKPIDYSLVNKKMEELQEKSMSFLIEGILLCKKEC